MRHHHSPAAITGFEASHGQTGRNLLRKDLMSCQCCCASCVETLGIRLLCQKKRGRAAFVSATHEAIGKTVSLVFFFGGEDRIGGSSSEVWGVPGATRSRLHLKLGEDPLENQ